MRTPDIQGIKTIDPNAVFSVLEASKLLGMTHNGVLNRIKKNLIHAGRTGSRYFIPGSEIQKQITLPSEEQHDI